MALIRRRSEVIDIAESAAKRARVANAPSTYTEARREAIERRIRADYICRALTDATNEFERRAVASTTVTRNLAMREVENVLRTALAARVAGIKSGRIDAEVHPAGLLYFCGEEV